MSGTVIVLSTYKGFTNFECDFYPCHEGTTREFNCLFCYCPLMAYQCPGNYRVLNYKGVIRKDCSSCILPHNGHGSSWRFIQKWLEKPVLWSGTEQKAGNTTGVQLGSVDKRVGCDE